MVTLYFDMDRESFKPKIVSSEYPDLTFMVDTGAETPVWCLGEYIFRDTFSDAKRLKYKYLLSGFGIGAEVVDVFSIPEFHLSDGQHEIIYQNMIIAVTNRASINASLILSASLFHHMDLDINRMKSVMYPTLSVSSENQIVPVFFKIKELSAKQRKFLGLNENVIVSDIYAEEIFFEQ